MSIRNLQQRSAKVAGVTFLLLLPIGLYANLIAPKVGLIMFACDVVIAVAFYLLLRNANFYLAIIGSIFRVINAAIGSISIFNPFNHSTLICLIFFSLGMAIHGYALFISNFIPQLLSGFYSIAAILILVFSIIKLNEFIYLVPDILAELTVALWFIIKGIKAHPA